jgi:hypothetical protein
LIFRVSANNKKKECRVLFSYQPKHEDELKLEMDDVVDFVAEVEDGWWKGTYKVHIFQEGLKKNPIICDIYRKFFLNFVGFPEYLNFTCTFSEFVFFSDNFYEVSIMLLGNYFVN